MSEDTPLADDSPVADDAPLTFVVEDGESGRADHVVSARFPQSSRKAVATLFVEGSVRVNRKKAKKGQVVSVGQTITLARAPSTTEDLRVQAEDVDLTLVHEDSDLVVVVKPAGIPSYPLRVGELGTLANRLVARFPECRGVGEDPRESGLAHRLDTHTSGLLIAARNQEAWQGLRRSFGAGEVHKTYLAAVHDRPIGVECEEPLLQQGKRVSIDYAGLDAHTTWELLDRNDNYALLRCRAHTGRMHQVRAHLAHCGSAIVGDTLYGGQAQPDFSGHFLHASTLSFPHPITGERLTMDAPLPSERAKQLATLKLQEPASA